MQLTFPKIGRIPVQKVNDYMKHTLHILILVTLSWSQSFADRIEITRTEIALIKAMNELPSKATWTPDDAAATKQALTSTKDEVRMSGLIALLLTRQWSDTENALHDAAHAKGTSGAFARLLQQNFRALESDPKQPLILVLSDDGFKALPKRGDPKPTLPKDVLPPLPVLLPDILVRDVKRNCSQEKLKAAEARIALLQRSEDE